MSTTITPSSAAPTPASDDADLKARHRAIWAMGDYGAVARDVVAPLGPVLVEAAGIGPGQRVHDVAAGSGNVAIPAALAGATVVATDLTPQLLSQGREAAERQGLEIIWREADAEALPCDDGEFDAVLSCVGVMFAPHHQAAADQLVRVVRPGGTIALISWTPEGFIGQMFAVMKPFAPAPAAGTQAPPLWGRLDHVRELFGARVSQLAGVRRALVVDSFATPEAFRDYFKDNYGPTIAVYRSIGDDPARVAALDHELAALATTFDRGDDGLVMDWEYLLVTAVRSTTVHP